MMRQAERRAAQTEALDHAPQRFGQPPRRLDVGDDPRAQLDRDASRPSMTLGGVYTGLQPRTSEAQRYLFARFRRPVKIIGQTRQRRHAFVPALVGALGRIAADGPRDATQSVLARALPKREDPVFVDSQPVAELIAGELFGEELVQVNRQGAF